MKAIIKSVLRKFNLGVTSYGRLSGLQCYEDDIASVLSRPTEDLVQLLEARVKSKSQINQDLFVLLETGFKRNGFFVEFGATNGVDLSNTYLLERGFGWTGILAEPARIWHEDLRKNRKCDIEENCVWRDSNSILDFDEVKEPELSTIGSFKSSDWASKNRRHRTTYKVNTISLTDLLKKYSAPKIIDYLSIDTEGSEFEILSHFDFDAYQFRVITCEHNFTRMRGMIFDLLRRKGYQRKYVGLSKWDDWYVREA